MQFHFYKYAIIKRFSFALSNHEQNNNNFLVNASFSFFLFGTLWVKMAKISIIFGVKWEWQKKNWMKSARRDHVTLPKGNKRNKVSTRLISLQSERFIYTDFNNNEKKKRELRRQFQFHIYICTHTHKLQMIGSIDVVISPHTHDVNFKAMN